MLGSNEWNDTMSYLDMWCESVFQLAMESITQSIPMNNIWMLLLRKLLAKILGNNKYNWLYNFFVSFTSGLLTVTKCSIFKLKSLQMYNSRMLRKETLGKYLNAWKNILNYFKPTFFFFLCRVMHIEINWPNVYSQVCHE